MRSGVSLGWLTTSKWSFFSAPLAATVRSRGIRGGGGPRFPVTAVRWALEIVPMGPPTFTIFVEARLEESVIKTWLRGIGGLTLPRLRNGGPPRETRSASVAGAV